MTQAKSSLPALLEIGDGVIGNEQFTPVAEIMDFTAPDRTNNTEDVTNHQSPEGYEEFIVTTRTGGEISFDVNYFGDPTQGPGAGLYLDFENKTFRNFRILDTEVGTQDDFTALVTKFQIKYPVKGRVNASITLKVSGHPVLTMP